MTRRLVAVLGYSNGGHELHAICRARLRRAETEARTDDVVLLSGWARRRSARSEAALMGHAWSGACQRLVLDHAARSTVGNVRRAAQLARELGVDEVVLVTSGWHARRAGALLRSALRGSNTSVRVASTVEQPPSTARAREIACWVLVPFGAVTLSRRVAS